MSTKLSLNVQINKYSVLIILFLIILYGCSEDDCTVVSSASSVPILTTADVSEITFYTAICGGTITSDGGLFVTTRGVYWSTSQSPIVDDNKTDDGSGAGSFISEITNLTPNTNYYIRAYATNSAGTGYGGIMSFTTPDIVKGTVTDIDGNIYQTIVIGNQEWMAENLKVTHYRNGESIPKVTSGSEWSNLTTDALCSYNNDDNNAETYGLIYNWYAVNDNHNICPIGWHVPTDEDCKELEMYLGMSQAEADAMGLRGTDEGGKLKDTSTTYWKSPNTGAANETGFSALPGGYREVDGNFYAMGEAAMFWSSTVYGGYFSLSRYLGYDYSTIWRNWDGRHTGFSLRLVRD